MLKLLIILNKLNSYYIFLKFRNWKVFQEKVTNLLKIALNMSSWKYLLRLSSRWRGQKIHKKVIVFLKNFLIEKKEIREY